MNELILSRFRGRPDVVAVCQPGGTFAPHRFDVGQEMQPGWLTQHLTGKRCLGFYLMRGDDRVLCSCVDFDNKDTHPDPMWKGRTEQLYFELGKMGMHPVVEVSQSGEAAHVWLFFDSPVEARLVRAFWSSVAESLGTEFREVYPRQDHLKDGGIGNLVRYPLWGKSHFVDVEDEWKRVNPAAALDVPDCNEFELSEMVARLGGSVDANITESGVSSRVERLLSNEYSLLGRRWCGDLSGLRDQTRSAAAQSLACELVRQYVPTNEVEDALRRWCQIHDYSKGDRDDWIDSTVEKAYGFVVSRKEERSRDVVTMLDACNSYLDLLQSGRIIHIASGIRELDESCEGVGVGEMAVVAARSGHGKSTLGLQWIHNAARRGTPCLVVSEEMSSEQLGKKSLLWMSEVPEDDQHAKVSELRFAAQDFYGECAPIYVAESCYGIDRCEELIDQMAQVYGVKLVAVDYMQMLDGEGQTRTEKVTDVSRKLKQVARRNEVSLIALCQLNREIEKRPKRQPMLSDLRESGQIEQDADLVIFLVWPWKWDSTIDRREYFIYIAKRRNGAVKSDRVQVRFNSDQQRIGMDAWDD